MNHFRFFSRFLFAVIFATTFFSGNVFAADNGILSVTQISAVKTYAIADGTFENGWQWIFDVTVPYNETILKMKFNDWINGGNLVVAADNVRFYSAQSANANSAASAIMITEAGEYSLSMDIIPETSNDLDFAKTGRQIKIIAEVRVPKGSAGGSYSTSYGIFTDIDENIEISNPSYNFIKIDPNPELSNQITIEEGEGFDVADFYIAAGGSTMQVDQIILEFNDDPQKYFSNMMISVSEQATRQRLIEQKDIAKIDENKYALTIWTDFSVSENAVRRLRVRLATKNYVNSTQMPAIIQVGLPAQGVRAFDRFGNYYYSDAPMFFRNVIINRSYAGEAEIILNKNANSPLNRNIIADANQTINNATLLSFDIKTMKGELIFDELNGIGFEVGDQYLVPERVYLIDDGGFVLSSAVPDNSGKLNFNSFLLSSGYVLPKDSTRTFLIKIDDKLAEDDNSKIYRVLVDSTGVVATKYDGQKLENDKKSGSAVSNNAYAYAEGPEFTLASITTTNTQAPYENSSSTMSATFNIQAKAVNGDVYLSNSSAFTVESSIGGATSTVADVTYVQPSNTVAEGSAYKISEGNTATFAVNATISNGGIAGTYDIRIAGITWGHVSGTLNVLSSYMNGEAAWISPAIYLR